VRLLHRTTRQVTLTEEGAIYAERARQALDDLSEAEHRIQDLKDNPTGVLRVNAPMAFGTEHLTATIARFAETYPNVLMEVEFDDRQVDPIGEGYDVVVRIGALQDSSLIARKIADCPIFLVASPAFIERYGAPATPDDVSKLPAIVYTKHQAVTDWRYRHTSGATGVAAYSKSFGANSAGMMADACRQGLGLSELPIFAVAKYLDSGELVRVLPDYVSDPERGIYAVFPRNRYLSTKVRLFVDWLTKCGRDLPW
jgi:DNA-binding transcriptional LysR family regulator